MDIVKLFNSYSGIFAIFGYLILFLLYVQIRKAFKKKEVPAAETVDRKRLDVNDEDALAACLAAAIECREEMHENVRILSVRRIG